MIVNCQLYSTVLCNEAQSSLRGVWALKHVSESQLRVAKLAN